MAISQAERLELAKTRIQNILRKHGIATAQILEQKISDAGPSDQRIDPHILTQAQAILGREGVLGTIKRGNVPWHFLTRGDANFARQRLMLLEPIQLATQQQAFTMRMGQALEIAIFKALRVQNDFHFLGSYPDLDEHDDSRLYSKEEPPSSFSGHRIRGGKKLDFLLVCPSSGPAGIEAKNIREWLYPDREEIREMIAKCCDIDAVPVLIGRRIPYASFSVLNPCGVLLHQMYNQRYARTPYI